MADVFEELPVPHMSRYGKYEHDEIRFSEEGYLPKGCTLGKNQGVLLGGTVLACDDRDEKYYARVPGGANGLGVARGVLAFSQNLGSVDQEGTILYGGVIKLEKMHGLDNNAISDLNGHVNDKAGFFKF